MSIVRTHRSIQTDIWLLADWVIKNNGVLKQDSGLLTYTVEFNYGL
jgi:hypothetical protein